MIDELALEVEALARRKGYRLRRGEQFGYYWLVDADTGLPQINPDDDSPLFSRAAALQFLLGSRDATRAPGHYIHSW